MTEPAGPSGRAQSVCVVGLGKIGLPLAVQYAMSGFQVFGADIDEQVVAQINDANVPFPGEAYLEERLREVVASRRLTATTETTDAVRKSDVVVIVVPLIVDSEGKPDFRHLDAATSSVGAGLTRGSLVIYETTVPVHTTRQRFGPMLADASSLSVGDELFIAFSPERVYSGRIFSDLRRYPKLVGGLDSSSTLHAIDFYTHALQFDERPDLERPNGVWNVGSAEAAELAKLAETTYRDINIAFANELAVYAESIGINVFEVIDAANSQPFSHIHLPGVAVGGHCIPVYPRLYLSTATESQLPVIAREVNEGMPDFVVEMLASELGSLEKRTVVVLGLSYRGGVKETAFSGAFPLVASLEARGAYVEVHDPLYTDEEIRGFGLTPAPSLLACDAAIIQADHAEYADLRPADLPGLHVIVDGRRITNSADWSGVRHLQLGAPQA